jgi:hypothetical protein
MLRTWESTSNWCDWCKFLRMWMWSSGWLLPNASTHMWPQPARVPALGNHVAVPRANAPYSSQREFTDCVTFGGISREATAEAPSSLTFHSFIPHQRGYFTKKAIEKTRRGTHKKPTRFGWRSWCVYFPEKCCCTEEFVGMDAGEKRFNSALQCNVHPCTYYHHWILTKKGTIKCFALQYPAMVHSAATSVELLFQAKNANIEGFGNELIECCKS